MRRGLVALLACAVLLGGLLVAFFSFAPAEAERRMNGVTAPPPYGASEQADELHRTLDIADLHADSLLWGRDLLVRGDRGHVDVPRLIEANVALQVFSVVTKSPRGLNIERNTGATDNITLLALAQRWPPATWTSLMQRALYQAHRLQEMARLSDGRLVVIRTRRDLAAFLKRRSAGERIVGALLALEGAHALEGDVANVDVLFEAGFRMMSPAHFFDNEMAGSAHGVDKQGLTEKGRAMIRRMEELRMIVDLAHSSESTFDDVIGMAQRPVVVSHTGVRGTCDSPRNLSDAGLDAVARNGGLVGIGYWQVATCGTDAAAIAAALRYTAARIGAAHVGLGSDFDGAVATPFDTTGIVQITDALLGGRMPRDEIGAVMGGNTIRFLLDNLPD